LSDRVFYEDTAAGWFAFLSAPPHTKGHAILAAIGGDGQCPQGFAPEILHGLDTALSEVVQAILKDNAPHIENVLFASLRGQEPHFHVHPLPLWPKEEKCWREVTGYRDSHLMEFIGSLEKKRDFLLLERAKTKKENGKTVKGKTEEEQRLESTKELLGEIQALRKITGYKLDANKA
jgi:diadenosine tetraphosphate (Ap4A) HIT family hydrolase